MGGNVEALTTPHPLKGPGHGAGPLPLKLEAVPSIRPWLAELGGGEFCKFKSQYINYMLVAYEV